MCVLSYLLVKHFFSQLSFRTPFLQLLLKAMTAYYASDTVKLAWASSVVFAPVLVGAYFQNMLHALLNIFTISFVLTTVLPNKLTLLSMQVIVDNFEIASSLMIIQKVRELCSRH